MTSVSTVTFTIVGLRRDAGPARQVVLPYFDVALRGGQTVAAKQIGQAVLNFAAGDAARLTRESRRRSRQPRCGGAAGERSRRS